ncbi:AraC family transcriptional regulator [Muricauda sp. 2012CJ35-5]|uniref:AraC family transcriptional regulator n=1 Tax=Flagellimonas spongiicola TaxID=2942208 RepID=A0ABT0PM92_9FLAO|nr:AraC family transcriptional regulator [Allomuricauda spongiicola]MCL6272492.1 AraC family transcriptional regulator [Allomuricauda spongiicola]
MNLGYLLGLLSIGQGIFLTFYILTTRTKEHFIKLLLIAILLIEVFILYDEVFLSYNTSLPWQLFLYGSAGAFLLGPSCYFLARKLRHPSLKLKPWEFLHILPFVVSLVFILNQYHLLPIAEKMAYIEYFNREDDFERQISVAEFLVNGSLRFHLLVYSVLAFFQLKGMTSIQVDSKLVTIRFAKFLVLGLGILGLFTLGNALLNQFEVGSMNLKTEAFIICFASHIFGLTFFYFKRNYIQYQAVKKYGKSGLSNKEETEIYDKLLVLMHQKELFTDPLLSLPKLAKELETNTHYLSQVINAKTSQSYHAYINDFRCNKAKDALVNPVNSEKTIEEIGLICGFGSASNFYRSFRNKFNYTPANYRKSYANTLD